MFCCYRLVEVNRGTMAQSASPASTGSADESAESLALTKQLMDILQTPAMVRLLAASSISFPHNI